MSDADDRHLRPICLMLLPRPLDGFILRDQAEDLLRAPGVVAVDPPRASYGALLRMPPRVAGLVVARQASRILATTKTHGDRVAAVMIFHAVQAPLARAIQLRQGGAEHCELLYGRWDRYEEAYDATPKRRRQLADLHQLAAANASLTFCASDELARLESEAGRAERTIVTTLAADLFPAPDPDAAIVAVSLGHLGWRTDWALLRAAAERLGDRLVLLLVGAWHEDEVSGDPDFAWCRAHPGFVWLGRMDDEAAARMILCADVGIVPFARTAFNESGLPYRILKYARLGRRTVSPDLPGVRTWARAVTTCVDAGEFADALAAEAGRRTAPDGELRQWALAQTAATLNAPLRERLAALGIDAAPR